MADHGMFHWNELMTRDLAQAKDFYGKSLGWRFEEAPMPGGMIYTLIYQGEAMVGGMMQMEGPQFEGVPDHWLTYVAVDDIDKRVELLKEAGGSVMQEPFDVEGVGRIAMVADPGGAMQGWMKPAPDSM